MPTPTPTTVIPTGAGEELYCLLVPLADDRLLLPRSCVTEVINYQAPTPMDGAPPWYLGTIAWGGRRVPLVSFEATLGRALPRTSGRTRIVVMQAFTTDAGGNFALLTQGFPQLVRLSPDVVHPDRTQRQALSLAHRRGEIATEVLRHAHLGHDAASALLAGGGDDRLPVAHLLFRLPVIEPDDAAGRQHRHNRPYPQLGRLLQRPVHALAA
ncbi:MAG: chemotaxis protein [Steroidobacteraceae bacterium]|nr:chemotaxis protein [Steroidobacteraceae bacterium]